MDAGEVVRAARRAARLSQRGLAARAGVAASTVAGIESGRRQPSFALVARLVDVAGSELALDQPAGQVCRHVRRHLHRSLSSRLHLLLGGDGRPLYQRTLEPWLELVELTHVGRLHLAGPSAVGLWLPMPEPLPVVVGLTLRDGQLPPVSSLDLVEAPLPRDCTVEVPLPIRVIFTPPPALLALDPACAPWRRALRAVARVLDEEAPKDAADRRAPAHRDARRDEEADRLFYARRWTSRFRPPNRLDTRGWRLGDDVGFGAWIDRRAERG